MRTAFAGTEAVFICTEDRSEEEHLVVPAAAAAKAGYPHDLVQTVDPENKRLTLDPIRQP